MLVLKEAPWQGQSMVELPPYWTVQIAWVQVALKAFHCPPTLISMEVPKLGWLKYALVFPASALRGATRTYPAGA